MRGGQGRGRMRRMCREGGGDRGDIELSKMGEGKGEKLVFMLLLKEKKAIAFLGCYALESIT